MIQRQVLILSWVLITLLLSACTVPVEVTAIRVELDTVVVDGEVQEKNITLQVVEPTTTAIITEATTPISPTSIAIGTHTPDPVSHPIYVGEQLARGYDMSVGIEPGHTNWVTNEEGHTCMAYPQGKAWGAVAITVGEPKQPPRPGQDLSAYRTLSLQLRGEQGGEQVWVGLKDNTDPDDGSETKVLVTDLSTDWQTFTFPLSEFTTADLTNLYVVTEFVFGPDTPAETVCFRHIQYLP